MFCVSLFCAMTLLMLLAVILISCLFYKIVSYITQCVTRPLTKLMMAKSLEAVEHTNNSI